MLIHHAVPRDKQDMQIDNMHIIKESPLISLLTVNFIDQSKNQKI